MNTIALDVMGGDYGPAVNVEGAIQAVKKYNDIRVVLVGRENIIKEELEKHKFNHPNLEICNADEVVGMDELPASAVRRKKNSSIVVAAQIVMQNKAQAIVSAGNSGAAMTSAMMLWRRLPGVSRPAITTVMPTLKGVCVLLDVGANVDCKPNNLLEFAIMGNIYIKEIFGLEKPRVGLLSIGEEQIKGNELTIETHKLLKNTSLNFIGNIEGGDIPAGNVDVAVCDGFIGNIILKFGEGIAGMLFSLIKSELKKHPLVFASIPFIWGALKDLRKRLDYTEYGGAPLLGVEGVCIICHGGSNSKAISNALRTANEFVDKNINNKISIEMQKYIKNG